MKYGFIKVAAATPSIKVADPEYNVGEIITLCREANEKKVKILTFPELCITGYTCGDLFHQSALLRGAMDGLWRIIHETKKLDMLIAVGVPFLYGGKIFNCAAVISHGKLLSLIPKTYLPSYGEFYEKRWFSPYKGESQVISVRDNSGREHYPVFGRCIMESESTFGLSVGVELCEDLWTMDPPSRVLAENGAVIILNLSASNELIGKSSYRRELVKTQSARLLSGYIYAGAGDGESTTDVVYSGHRMIGENGVILAENRFDTGLTISEIDVGRLLFERRRITSVEPSANALPVVRFSLEESSTTLTRRFSPTPFVPQDKENREERCREILTIQALGLKKRLIHTGSRAMVVGVSGGLDSTLALLVSARAAEMAGLPRESLVAVTMPCFGTTQRTKSNAILLAEKLGATTKTVDITKSVMQHFSDIGHDPENLNVVYENCQARERTQVLMDIANEVGGLVIGTGDLSELALGWATYNGDHMSMYAVNCGVPKTLVRHLVSYCADTAGDSELSSVLLDILDTPVSPELLPAVNGEISQRTEDLVGPYELHDFFLYYFMRWGFSPEKIRYMAHYTFEPRYEGAVIDKWLKVFIRRFFAQQFKRSCLPDGPKVGSVSLSPRGDWRMPSDASASLWLSRLEVE